MVNETQKEPELQIIDRFEKELKGSLTTLIILLIIKREKEIYGYKIKKILQKITKSDIMINDSTLYTSLRSLETKYEIIESKSIERKIYYSITDEGSKSINDLIEFWQETQIMTNNAIKELMEN